MKDHEESVKKEKKERKPSYFLRIRTRPDHKDPNYKSAALYSGSVIPPTVVPKSLSQVLQPKLDNILGNRPIAGCGSPATTPQKRPRRVFSPNGSEYTREKDYGFVLIYSNKGIVEAPRKLVLPTDLVLEEVLKESPPDNIKTQEIVVTEELVERAFKLQAAGKVRGKGGIPDQNTTMARPGVNKKEASATKIAKALGLLDNDQELRANKKELQDNEKEVCNWCHLILLMLKGLLAQDPNNLTGGTSFANTDMMFAEHEVINLPQTLGKEIKLYVKAIEEGYHFAKEIRYTIVTENFTLPFVFNAQTSVKPSFRNLSYIRALVETLVELTQHLLAKEPAAKKSNLFDQEPEYDTGADFPNLFFSKAPKEETGVSFKKCKKEIIEDELPEPPGCQPVK